MFKLLVFGLERLCTLCHHLPGNYDDHLQNLFITVFGYHCPFAQWSFWVDEKFNVGWWKAE